MKTLIISSLFLLTSLNSFAEPMRPTVEPLLGSMTSVDGVRIQVPTRGCTWKNSFIVQKESSGSVTTVTFIRVEFDPCLAFYYYGTALSYSYEELGLHHNEKFIISNPMTSSNAR
jgi:hypothetical protein